MAIDVKEMIEKAVKKISDNKDLLALFQKDPVKAIEKALNIDLPDELVEKLVDGVKAGIKLDTISDKLGDLGGVASKLKNLF